MNNNPSPKAVGHCRPATVAFATVLAVLLVMGTSLAADNAGAAYAAGRAAQDRDTRRTLFAQGMALAKSRLASNPDDAEGLYWLAVDMGAEAIERGKLAALPVVPRMEALGIGVAAMCFPPCHSRRWPNSATRGAFVDELSLSGMSGEGPYCERVPTVSR